MALFGSDSSSATFLKGEATDKMEFGDFQTPEHLAQQICQLLLLKGVKPSTIVEPTCGKGSFLASALGQFPDASAVLGLDINADYLAYVSGLPEINVNKKKVQLIQANFFEYDWKNLINSIPEPVLVVGNPPWVTNSGLGTINSSNLPGKSNFQNHRGLHALTGKSNFDISEWMLIRLLDCLNGRNSVLAMLCKTAVARKVLKHAWDKNLGIQKAEIYPVDAAKNFGAAVDACLLICHLSQGHGQRSCDIYKELNTPGKPKVIGYRNNQVIADVAFYDGNSSLFKNTGDFQWRSGIKHDCSKVMELTRSESLFVNGFGVAYDLEDTFLYPMLKSSELSKGEVSVPRKWMLVTQSKIAEDTGRIRKQAPKTWQYLQEYASFLEARKSSIYSNRPSFSIFGVGEYSFAPWKVAISGLYKQLRFKVVGSFGEKPVVLDDTCYFLPFATAAEAEQVATVLNSSLAQACLNSLIFWDAKRPVTIDVLKQIDIWAIARELGIRLPGQTSSSQIDSGICRLPVLTI